MSRHVPDSGSRGSGDFQQVAHAFLSGEGLSFAEILSAERIERVCAKHDCLFAMRRVYSTAIVLWSFLSQVLRDGKDASCQAAVARIVSHQTLRALPVPTADTGDYCRARGKLSAAAVRDLSGEVASELEAQAPPDWLWNGWHAKLVDGFTFTMPDTPENQAAFPHPKSQKPGVGLPIARAVAILSLATAAGAALLHDKQPRQISFTGACQYVLNSWMQLSCGLIPNGLITEYCLTIYSQIASCEVANRPGRLEPRVLKRRRHGYPLMQKPRTILRQELRKHCT